MDFRKIRLVSIINTTKNTVIAHQGSIADTFLSRMIGLLNKDSFLPDDALIITRCQSIHMLFMRFPIDAIFVDRHACVIGIVEHIKPFRLSRIFFKSSYVIELPAGSIIQNKTSLGDKIKIIKA